MVILGNLGKIMTSKWNACHRQNWGRVVWGVAMAYIMMRFLIKTVHKHFGFKTENTMIRKIFSPNKY